MKRLLILILTLFILMASVTFAKGDLPTAIIPAQTQWLIHFDMSQFLSTKLSQFLMGLEEKDFAEAQQKMLKELKLDPFKDLYSVTLFGSGADEEEAVVCIQANFDRKFLVSRLQEEDDYRKSSYGRHTIHKWEHRQYGTFVNSKMALLSQSESNLKKALDVMTGKGKNVKSASLFKQLKSLPNGAFLKAVTGDLARLTGHLKQASPLILQNARVAIFMALEKSEVLRLKLRLTTRDEDTATNIYQMVNGLMAMARLHKHNDSDLDHVKQLLEGIKIIREKNVIELELSLPSDSIIRLIEDRGHGKIHKRLKRKFRKK